MKSNMDTSLQNSFSVNNLFVNNPKMLPKVRKANICKIRFCIFLLFVAWRKYFRRDSVLVYFSRLCPLWQKVIFRENDWMLDDAMYKVHIQFHEIFV